MHILRKEAYYKKLCICLMIVMAALMFFGYKTDDNNGTVTGVTLNKNTLTLEVGKNDRLIATVTPVNADNTDVTWSSNNVNVAYVKEAAMVPVTGIV